MRNGTFGMLTAVLLLTAFLAGVVRATMAWEASTGDECAAIRLPVQVHVRIAT